MQATVKTKSGRVLVMPTDEEDAAITNAALSEPDALPLTGEEWELAKPQWRRGRPPSGVTKERITIRLSRDVVEAFRATGQGWQTRMDKALKEWLETHPV